jgi:hypothetical protein
VVDPVTPPARPAHIYAQQVMALALQLGGVARPDLDAWLGDVAAEVPEADRIAAVQHMLQTGLLAEEFGRRHFADLVAAFTTRLILAVFARALSLTGSAAAQWDDFSVSVRGTSTGPVARAIAEIDPADAGPPLPDDTTAALKFSICLPQSIAAAVLKARTAAPEAVAEILSRPFRQVRS